LTAAAGRRLGFSDSAGPDAVGANAHPFVCLSFNNSDLLQIGIPPTLGQVVRVAHPMSVDRTFVTDFASLRHDEKRSVSFAQVAPTLKSQTQEYSIWSAALSPLDVLQWPLFFKELESFREINFGSGGACRPACHCFL
jgi:hypothetical protein